MKLLLNIAVVLISLNVLLRNSVLEIDIGNNYFALFAFVFVFLLSIGRDLQFDFFIMLFVSACLVSILLNAIPAFFRPIERLIAFLMVSCLVGPFFKSDVLLWFRKRLFDLTNLLLVIMVTASFLGIAAGLSLMQGRSGFMGFFAHSMVLGPMAAVATLVNLNQAHRSKNRTLRWFYWGLAGAALLCCIAAGSRAALIGVVAGILFHSYKINQGNIVRFTRSVIVSATLIAMSYPIWNPYTAGLMHKMDYAEEQGDLLASRTNFWDVLIIEFESSPIIGIGFASIDPSLSEAGSFDEMSGRVEPGSSWLALLSMVGLLGFAPLAILIIINLVFISNKESQFDDAALNGALLILFIIHMMAEGYVLSAGGGLFFYFWLLLGQIDASIKFELDRKIQHNESCILRY